MYTCIYLIYMIKDIRARFFFQSLFRGQFPGDEERKLLNILPDKHALIHLYTYTQYTTCQKIKPSFFLSSGVWGGVHLTRVQCIRLDSIILFHFPIVVKCVQLCSNKCLIIIVILGAQSII